MKNQGVFGHKYKPTFNSSVCPLKFKSDACTVIKSISISEVAISHHDLVTEGIKLLQRGEEAIRENQLQADQSVIWCYEKNRIEATFFL